MATILLVDKSFTVLHGLKQVLESSHYGVITAQDGISTLSMVLAHQIDLVLLDHNLTHMNSFDLCVIIRHIANYRPLPIILAAEFLRPDEEDRMRQLGMMALLRKPIKPELLVSMVSDYLSSEATDCGRCTC